MTTLALLVVYVGAEQDLPLVSLHLDRIARHTRLPYTIYAGANRSSPEERALLLRQDNLRICDLPLTDLRGSPEHGFYLDRLVSVALDAQADYVCTLDFDSFPVRDGWDLDLAGRTTDDAPVAAVLRTENADTVLTHPSCLFARSEFFATCKPQFLPSDAAGLVSFATETGQEIDTGIGIAFALRQHSLGWHPLRRSNAVDLHPVLGGIYDDRVFHLGSSAWPQKIYRRDGSTNGLFRLGRLFESGGPIAKRVAFAIQRPARGRISARNNAAYDVIRRRLLAEADVLIDELRGVTSG